MIFKVNCERCGALLIKGEICNYKGIKLCEECYTLLYLFNWEPPAAPSAGEPQQRRRYSPSFILPLSTKR